MADLSSYEDYEEEFLRISRDLRSRISTLHSQIDDKKRPEQTHAEIRSIETDLWQAKQQLADMETEVRGFPESTRRELGNKISTYRDSVNSLQRDLEKLKNKSNRDSLLGSTGGDDMRFSGETQAQRERFQRSNERMAAGTDSLRQSQQTLDDTENLATDITSELARNRETLYSIRSRVGEESGMLDNARRVLRSMTRREHRFKLLLALFIIVLIIIIAVIIYFATKGSSSSDDD